MSKFVSKEDLAGKIDWEGGTAEAILGYGISSEDLPEGTPQEIVDAWGRVEDVREDIDKIDDWLSDYPEVE